MIPRSKLQSADVSAWHRFEREPATGRALMRCRCNESAFESVNGRVVEWMIVWRRRIEVSIVCVRRLAARVAARVRRQARILTRWRGSRARLLLADRKSTSAHLRSDCVDLPSQLRDGSGSGAGQGYFCRENRDEAGEQLHLCGILSRRSVLELARPEPDRDDCEMRVVLLLNHLFQGTQAL